MESFFFVDVYDGCSVINGVDYDGDDWFYCIIVISLLFIIIRMIDLNVNLDMFLFDCISFIICID